MNVGTQFRLKDRFRVDARILRRSKCVGFQREADIPPARDLTRRLSFDMSKRSTVRLLAMPKKALGNPIAFRYLTADSPTGVTRHTAKRIAQTLGVDETQAIHLALHELAIKCSRNTRPTIACSPLCSFDRYAKARHARPSDRFAPVCSTQNPHDLLEKTHRR
jgi:hypothetical protein